MNGLPESPLASVTALISGASTATEQDLRALYLASARTLLVAHAADVERASKALAAMEAELVRVAKSDASRRRDECQK